MTPDQQREMAALIADAANEDIPAAAVSHRAQWFSLFLYRRRAREFWREYRAAFASRSMRAVIGQLENNRV